MFSLVGGNVNNSKSVLYDKLHQFIKYNKSDEMVYDSSADKNVIGGIYEDDENSDNTDNDNIDYSLYKKDNEYDIDDDGDKYYNEYINDKDDNSKLLNSIGDFISEEYNEDDNDDNIFQLYGGGKSNNHHTSLDLDYLEKMEHLNNNQEHKMRLNTY